MSVRLAAAGATVTFAVSTTVGVAPVSVRLAAAGMMGAVRLAGGMASVCATHASEALTGECGRVLGRSRRSAPGRAQPRAARAARRVVEAVAVAGRKAALRAPAVRVRVRREPHVGRAAPARRECRRVGRRARARRGRADLRRNRGVRARDADEAPRALRAGREVERERARLRAGRALVGQDERRARAVRRLRQLHPAGGPRRRRVRPRTDKADQQVAGRNVRRISERPRGAVRRLCAGRGIGRDARVLVRRDDGRRGSGQAERRRRRRDRDRQAEGRGLARQRERCRSRRHDDVVACYDGRRAGRECERGCGRRDRDVCRDVQRRRGATERESCRARRDRDVVGEREGWRLSRESERSRGRSHHDVRADHDDRRLGRERQGRSRGRNRDVVGDVDGRRLAR